MGAGISGAGGGLSVRSLDAIPRLTLALSPKDFCSSLDSDESAPACLTNESQMGSVAVVGSAACASATLRDLQCDALATTRRSRGEIGDRVL